MDDVVVVGAGPVGLWLAAELRLGGVAVTVLERRHERDPHSKALTIHPRTLEILAFRGIVDRFLAEGPRLPSGHFGALAERLDFGVLDTPFPFTLAVPQARTEELLEEHAIAAGAKVERGHRVAGLTQDGDAVHLDVEGPDGPYRLDAAYVVGCDGAGSTVRTAAGIEFPGTDTTTWGWLGDVALDDPPPRPISSFQVDGGVMMVPLTPTLYRFVGLDPADIRPDWPGELTLDQMRERVAKILGTDFGMRDPVWLSRFGNATRQAARYRHGRVLLAGDAAHMHFPTGGVGLNVGVQDATNLGWKLAATVAGRAPEGLLDTYHEERHPVGSALLDSTRAQTALMAAFSVEGQALRGLLGQLVGTVPEFSRLLAERVSALDVAYPGDGLVGKRVPDLKFARGEKSVFDLMRTGRHVLLDLADTGSTPDGVDVHSGPFAGTAGLWAEAATILIRPDGYVAWTQGSGGRTP